MLRDVASILPDCGIRPCLTRWEPIMDYLAGHRDMSITKRYIHPQEQNTRAAIEKARKALNGHRSGHTTDGTPARDFVSRPVSGQLVQG